MYQQSNRQSMISFVMSAFFLSTLMTIFQTSKRCRMDEDEHIFSSEKVYLYFCEKLVKQLLQESLLENQQTDFKQSKRHSTLINGNSEETKKQLVTDEKYKPEGKFLKCMSSGVETTDSKGNFDVSLFKNDAVVQRKNMLCSKKLNKKCVI